ncbi:hypothetical protein M2G96_12300 [Vibrio vulnificus]|nr:hypothetical protein [Vibrio vulnificus]MCU8269024.1 hypothetical protein [Vibrio vulnificus]
MLLVVKVVCGNLV